MSSENNRVVITGIGIVSSLGHELDLFWRDCLAGCSPVTSTPTTWQRYYRSKSLHWSPLDLPDYRSVGLRRSDVLAYDVAALNCIYAAGHALQQSGCVTTLLDERSGRHKIECVDEYRCGVYVGTGLGCITSTFQNYVPHLLSRSGLALSTEDDSGICSDICTELAANLAEQPRVLPVASTKCMANSLSALLSIRYGLRGANETVVAACAAGAAAIARAFEQIRYGKIDLALAGGSEYYGDRAGGVFMAFDRLNTLAKPRECDENVNRPFDMERTGFLFSQGGACILALESLESAQRRGSTIIAELKGTSATSDGYSLAALAPDGGAIKRMIRDAVRDAGILPRDIDYINSHGTGTIPNDELEASILDDEFPHQPLVNSSKSILGHTIGACGAIETAISALSIFTGQVHPNVNLTKPVRDLNFPLRTTSADISFALSHNFGFGGHNVGLVLAKYPL